MAGRCPPQDSRRRAPPTAAHARRSANTRIVPVLRPAASAGPARLPWTTASSRRPCRRPGSSAAARSSTASWGRSGTRCVAMVAPAGYGKTTVLAQWAARDPRPFAWVAVDARDDDPAHLLTHVAAAVERALDLAAGALRPSATAGSAEHSTSALRRAVAAAEHSLVLVPRRRPRAHVARRPRHDRVTRRGAAGGSAGRALGPVRRRAGRTLARVAPAVRVRRGRSRADPAGGRRPAPRGRPRSRRRGRCAAPRAQRGLGRRAVPGRPLPARRRPGAGAPRQRRRPVHRRVPARGALRPALGHRAHGHHPLVRCSTR